MKTIKPITPTAVKEQAVVDLFLKQHAFPYKTFKVTFTLFAGETLIKRIEALANKNQASICYACVFWAGSCNTHILGPEGLEQMHNEYINALRTGHLTYRSTGSKKRHGRYFRRIKTHRSLVQASQDLKQDMEEGAEIACKPRAKQNASNIPTSWDDFYRSNQKSWKKHRKFQYKSA